MNTTTIDKARQRDEALRKGNRRRLTGAKALRTVAHMPTRNGVRELARMIETGDERIMHIGLARLLVTPAYWGDGRRRRVARNAGMVTIDRKLRDMTVRQRRAVADAMRLELSRSDPTRAA